MIDPAMTNIDIEEQRAWVMDRKTVTPWSDLAAELDIKLGTLSQFGSSKGYKGDELTLAEKIFRYRQTLTRQAAIALELPEVPGYFPTPTSDQLIEMLHFAQRGKLVVAAFGAGLGKTITAEHFKACYGNVFMATMTGSTAGINNMQAEILEALGEKNPVGTPRALSKRIKHLVGELGNPLLIIDEAQHASQLSIEEIRSWRDATGCGIALLGNIGVLQRFHGGTSGSAFAQLSSRINLQLERATALIEDIDALARAWKIGDHECQAYLRKLGVMPGGLRGLTFTLELALMAATNQGKPLEVRHIREAWQARGARAVAA